MPSNSCKYFLLAELHLISLEQTKKISSGSSEPPEKKRKLLQSPSMKLSHLGQDKYWQCCYPARRVFILKRRAGKPDGQTAINETILYYRCWGKEFHVLGVHFYSTSPWDILRMECVSLPPLHSYKACRCKRCKGMVPVSTMQPGAKMQPELLGSCCLAASNAFRASLLSILSTQRRSVVPRNWLYFFLRGIFESGYFSSIYRYYFNFWFPFVLQLCFFHLSILLVYFFLFWQAKTEIPRSFCRLGRCGLRSRKRRLKIFYKFRNWIKIRPYPQNGQEQPSERYGKILLININNMGN